MRLFLIPISTHRTLLYAQRLSNVTATPSYADKLSARAAKMWLSWESHDKGWQKQCTVYGNKLFNRIPFEEWGLKSVPPLSSLRYPAPPPKVDIIYPDHVLDPAKIPNLLQHLGSARTALHRRNLMWSVIGMPIVAPFALVPVIPNLPFFYLVYRAFSHWRALEGGKHLRFIVDKGMANPLANEGLGAVYAERRKSWGLDAGVLAEKGVEEWTSGEMGWTPGKGEERLLVEFGDAKRIAEVLELPALAVECERAVTQVEEQIRTKAHQVAQGIRLQKAEVKEKKDQ